MQPFLGYLASFDETDVLAGAVLLLATLAAALVGRMCWQERRLARHQLLLERLDLRLGNLHRDREATRVRKLQHPIVPPPLPPRAPTVGGLDWEEELVDTEKKILSRDTKRYPKGKPPEDTQ